MVKLRKYQQDAINTIKKEFSICNKQYIVIPTGGGKTITFLKFLEEKNKKALIIVPSKQLLNQIYDTSLLFFHKDEISRKGNFHDEKISKIHICIINSVRDKYAKYLFKHPFDYVVIDEAHHVMAKSYRSLIENLSKKNKSTKFLGVTATPDRSDGILMNEIMGNESFNVSLIELINQMHLSDIEGFTVKTGIEINDIDGHNGDFSLIQLYKRLSCESRNNLIWDTYNENFKKRKTLIFCINIAHSKEVCKLFQDKGISCEHIDGTMKSHERNRILKAFREGDIKCLTNCQLLTEGFDEPSIDGVILARPTKSKSLFLQMIGRGLRIFPGKENCKVLDIVDNHNSVSNFNAICGRNGKLTAIRKFGNTRDLVEKLEKEHLKIEKTVVTSADLLDMGSRKFEDMLATQSTKDYLMKFNIPFYESLSLKEGSFLVFVSNLKMEEIHALIASEAEEEEALYGSY